MLKLSLLVPCALLSIAVGCSKPDPDPAKSSDDGAEGADTERSESTSKRKSKDKESKDKESKSEQPESEGDPSEGIAACDDWRKKLSSCEVLKKTAPSLIEKTAVVWRKKGTSKGDIEKDCKEKTANLPKVCR